jgi:predicted TIM-barrel fold metal-dependent hydrolase
VIPLFDSLAHPTVSGRWESRLFSAPHDARVETLIASMRAAGFRRACAVGMAGVGGYEHEAFAALCRPFPELVPFAGIDPMAADPLRELDTVRELGFRGIKLHPRLSGFALDDDAFVATLAGARDRDLVVMLCTYLHAPIPAYPSEDPLYALARALKRAPGVRIVLLHGGDVDLLRWAQLARHDEHLLLDLSFTMMKYRGSSIDADLRYLFGAFHRRVCIGVDHPEYGHDAVRVRFEELAAGLGDEPRRDVAYRSLSRFLGIDPAWE